MLYAAGRLRDFSFTQTHAEDEPRATERLGQPSRERPKGLLLWFHADSPEDAGAAPALAQELTRTRGESFTALVTTTASGPLVPRVAADSVHQLVPGDTKGSVERFLDHWRPDVSVMIGVPDRPNLILSAKERGIPLFLAASSRGSLASRRRLSYISTDLLGAFDACLAASAADADVLNRHLEDQLRVEVTGPLSDATFALPCSDADRDTTARVLGGRPVWLAADVTQAEIAAIEAAHRKAFRYAHRLLLVIIPQDFAAARNIAGELAGKGWDVAIGSDGREIGESDQVYIADSRDEHGLWYRLAPITFAGGTLDPEGPSSDPYAAATLGSAVLHGPHTGAARPRFERLKTAGACIQVDGSEALGSAVQRLLAPDKAAELAQAGWRVTTESAHVVERLAELINAALDDREGR